MNTQEQTAPTPMSQTRLLKWAMQNKPLTPREEEIFVGMERLEEKLIAATAENARLREALEKLPHNPNCATQQMFFSEARRAEQAAKGCTCFKQALNPHPITP